MTLRASRHILHIFVVAGVVLATAVVGVAPAEAQTEPRVAIDRPEAAPGEPILVTFSGFDAQFVDIVLCGNLGYRGAADCAVTAGVSKETLSGGRPKVVEMIAHAPPTHCPCIVKATASSGETFAVAPIVLTGHPVAEIEGVPDGPLVEVEVEATEANQGVWASLRAALGGPTRYEGTVSVRNLTAETLENVSLDGSVARWLDDAAVDLDLEAPGPIAPGQTWSQDFEAEMSAPSLGAYDFEIVASGAGSTVTESRSVSHQPWLFYVFTLVLVVDIVVALWRRIVRRATPRAETEDELIDVRELDDEDDLIEPAPEEQPALV